MNFSEFLNCFLGGGVVAMLVGLATMRATVRKAEAEAAQAKAQAIKAEAEAETVRITNAENATRILVANIVVPLRNELNATREELSSIKGTISRLTRAIEAANKCRLSKSCPVLGKLRNSQKNADGADAEHDGVRECRDKGRRNKGDPQGDGADESGEYDDPG